MIIFQKHDTEQVRLEKLHRLAFDLNELERKLAPFIAPAGFGQITRVYVDPANNDLVVQVADGIERRYAAI